MNSLTMGRSKRSKDILGHWLWALPILLIVAALALRQVDLYAPTADEFFSMNNSGWLVNGPYSPIDLYPPTVDEFHSMNNSGWLVNGAYSPIDVMQSLQRYSPNHTPGYFILLSIWGNLIAYDIALARIFTIFTGLLSLSIAYRLARDFVAPVAGLFALIVMSSNTFYNYYVPFVRFYPLLVFTSGVILWLYLRIMFRAKSPKALDYFTLFAAVFALENTHVFCAAFLVALGIYHLLFAPKNRRWLRVTATAVAAFAIFLPVLINMTNGIIESISKKFLSNSIDGMTALGAWINLMLNEQPGLLIIVIAGLLLVFGYKTIPPTPVRMFYLLLTVIFLLILTLMAEYSGFIRAVEMRYHLVNMLPFMLSVAAGIYSLYSFRRWLGLLALLWIAAGVGFQIDGDWRNFAAGKLSSVPLPPWPAMSREALRAEQKPQLIGYRLRPGMLGRTGKIGYSQKHHYFDRHGIELKLFSVAEAFGSYIRSYAIALPSVWIVYQTSAAAPHEIARLQTTLDGLNYQLCDTRNIAVDTVILQYAWKTLNCQPPQLLANHQTTAIDYQFYGAALHAADSKLYFSDQWTARTDDDLSGFQMSYQLISADWSNVAQLDLPLVHEGQTRLFSIDISDVPTGQYRLMAILYDKRPGQRQNWLNNTGDLPNMLTLTDIAIPAR